MELTLVLVVSVTALLRPAASAQSSVYVKFLSPPHGYSHRLQISPSGAAISKESRIYPGDNKRFAFQQNHLLKNQLGYSFNNQNHQSYSVDNKIRQGYPLNNVNNQYQPGYPLTLRYQPGYPLSNQHHQDQPLNNQYSQPLTSPGYFYAHPQKPFEEYGPAREPYPPAREPFPSAREYPALSRPQAEVTYDPNLITGPEAARYVSYLFSQGELFFHLIPHERLVLMNQQERIANNLDPHILASIRPGHPFFLHR